MPRLNRYGFSGGGTIRLTSRALVANVPWRRDSSSRWAVRRGDRSDDRESGGCTLTRPGTCRGDPGRGGVTAATLDSKSSAREGVRVQLPPPVPFLDNVPRTLVGCFFAWGCSSVGRAQGWQSWGQGFDSPQLHHLIQKRTFAPTQPAIGAPGAAKRSTAIGLANALKFRAPALA